MTAGAVYRGEDSGAASAGQGERRVPASGQNLFRDCVFHGGLLLMQTGLRRQAVCPETRLFHGEVPALQVPARSAPGPRRPLHNAESEGPYAGYRASAGRLPCRWFNLRNR